ncbi:MAG: T9SS type A sorting domain-containing protein [Bacteroidota bacterium]|nr:T9SS type A sorting domain-containing protein [Bacteroidota bacterium]MDP3145569.1 T9SS type A sorting domain-containing protein [Bacteroidota bacterium]
MKFKSVIIIFCCVVFNQHLFSQATCAGAFNLGTPTTAQACFNFTNATTGSAPCAGAGYGGSGGVTYVRFCTNATAQCINFTINQGTASGNWAVTVYSINCSTVMDAQCLGNSGTGATFNTATPTTNTFAPNTCYVARIWSANNGSFTLCTQVLPAPNDYCTSPTQISPTAQFLNNYCMTANTPTDPPAAQFCAGSLENNAWYSITTLSTCTFPCQVVITISNIVCSGGGSGFQIGYFTGACGTLTNIGCTSGSGGTVTATINNLSPNQTVLIGIDGNAGANCSYSISATNTIPLDIQLLSFEATKNKGYIAINWYTIREVNNNYFTIEKSKDASVFETVSVVSGAGNSSKNVDYLYNDNKPFDGISYYRIKQTDYDGRSKYSQMRAIEYKNETKLNFDIIPNPSNSAGYNLRFESALEEQYLVEVTDLAGKIIYSIVVNVNNSKNNISSSLHAGMYMLNIRSLTTNNLIGTKKLLISE